MADTLNRRFTNCPYCKIVVTVLGYFLQHVTTSFTNYHPESGVLVHVEPSSVLCFH